MTRSVLYTTSPLLASKTPLWRSKFIVAALALGFVGLGARAAYVQVFGNDFFKRQGLVRFARTLELPANRGRLLDRNGLILASSVPAASIWAIPEDVDLKDPEVQQKLKQVAQLMEMPLPALLAKLGDEDKTFVWVKRQLDWNVGQQIVALNIKGIYNRKEYKRQYPEGESAAHRGLHQCGRPWSGGDGAGLRQGAGRQARFAPCDQGPPGPCGRRCGRRSTTAGRQDIQLSIDSKVQYYAYQKLKQQVEISKAKAGSVVVMDAHTGELLALANYPSYDPGHRKNLTGEQLRNRALTDTFEPGSTMKPITIATALELKRVKPSTIIDTAPGRYTVTGSTITDTHNYGSLTVEGVIQKSSNVGATKVAQKLTLRRCGSTSARWALARSRRSSSLVRFRAVCAPGRPGSPSNRPPCPMAMACRPRCSRWRARTPCSPTMAMSSRPPS